MIASELIQSIVLNLVLMVLWVSTRELAHVLVTERSGDLLRRRGRFRLSPREDYEFLGISPVPIATGFFGSPSFSGRVHQVRSAPVAAGVLAAICQLSRELLFARDGEAGLVYLLRAMFFVNVGLRVFNFLAISPRNGRRLSFCRLDWVVPFFHFKPGCVAGGCVSLSGLRWSRGVV